MGKIVKLIAVTAILINLIALNSYAQPDLKRETRAAWISTVWNMDWPTKSGDVNAQKQEFIGILDEVDKLGFNTIVVQVRPKADSFYKSNINPWSDILTGSQGNYPGYDPLKFMIDEAHKRNLDIHAWFNPYRITASTTENNKLVSSHPAKIHPEWVVNYKDKLYYNPGLPEVRQHIVDTVAEVVKNYDIDGIHFDDYFYPGKDFNDQEAYNKYGNGKDVDTFRRDSVNKMVESVQASIKNIKPYVKFGISPRGIWRNQSSDPTGSDTNGSESYDDIYADTRTWIQNGWVDYIVPQVYWEMDNSLAAYKKLVPWWSNEVKNKNTNLYIGQGIYKDSVAKEIESQIDLNKKFNEVKGSMYFSYSDIKNNRQGVKDKLRFKYQYKALPDVMPWIDNDAPTAPKVTINQNQSYNEINISNVDDAKYYVIYRFNNIENIDINDTSKIIAKVHNNGGIKTSYIDKNIIEKDYKYIVTSVDRLHNESNVQNETQNGLIYQTHIEDIGWQDWKTNGETSGTTGKNKRIEAIRVDLKNNIPGAKLKYRAHVEDIGWQNWKSEGEIAGTTGECKRVEAVQINLEEAQGYKVEYRVYIKGIGWQSWKSNGETAGTTGQAKQIEAIQVKVVKNLNVEYQTHIEDIGWQDWKLNGETSGTTGKAKQLEAIKINLKDIGINSTINYRTHIEDIGWQDWKSNGVISGTEGQSKRLEAIQIKLENVDDYNIKYRTHIEDIGWQDWKSNGEISGTTGKGKRIEAIEIKLTEN
ncbi:family 10 glycosylhydrolase [Paraclostridium bifermentans]|uniref:family 10 glycosylhydrolase n=1 Tax=Paraclostridium bifermentans TaxID=1490 RepID=UPI001A9AD0B8|nr:family 10 glycosylhydrolase [Paraclostridium bifermentans]